MSCTGQWAATTCGMTSRPTHASEWFQKTHTGLVLSSVSRRVYSRVMGGSRVGGRGGPSLCTVALTMAVLMTGRLGSLERTVNKRKIIASMQIKAINFRQVTQILEAPNFKGLSANFDYLITTYTFKEFSD